MKPIKFTTLDVVMLTIMGILSSMSFVECFVVESARIHDKLNLGIWILVSGLYFLLYKKLSSRQDRFIEVLDKPTAAMNQKAVNSAPSNLNTYEKSVYEEGFKDGFNYAKNEMNSVF